MLKTTKELLKKKWNIHEKLLDILLDSEIETKEKRSEFQNIAEYNQLKVIEAFQEHKISDSHFHGTTGYGFHDHGRESLDKICADIFRVEKGLVRWQFVSGTHALSSILFGSLRPGDRWISATGKPYDTLQPVIDGKDRWTGSLKEWGIEFEEVPLNERSEIDIKGVLKKLEIPTKLVYLQRSLGYTWRPSISINTMEKVIREIKSAHPAVIIMVDNCYGEFVETKEPTEIGADITGGSLIKNLGGGIAPGGGYIAGKAELVDKAAVHLTSPGIGPDEGATMGLNRLLFQGIFMAPHIVGQAVEGAILASHVMKTMGFPVMPEWNYDRTDIIQGILLGSSGHLKSFCRGIQKSSAVDSFAVPEAVDMPGYRDPIIMAGGTFIQGSSIELSSDGPLREPYSVYLQGGLSADHVKLGILNGLMELYKDGYINI